MSTALVKITEYNFYDGNYDFIDSAFAPSAPEAAAKLNLRYDGEGSIEETPTNDLIDFDLKSEVLHPYLENGDFNDNAPIRWQMEAKLRDGTTVRVPIDNWSVQEMDNYGDAPIGSILSRVLRPFNVYVGMCWHDC